jgi:hypothetical protein
MSIKDDKGLEQPIRIYEKDAKLIIFLTILLIIVMSLGSFYFGVQYSRTDFISETKYELARLLETNFSYVCGTGWEQFYLSNISFPLLLEGKK